MNGRYRWARRWLARSFALVSVAACLSGAPARSAENAAQARPKARTPTRRAGGRTAGDNGAPRYRAQSPGYDSEAAMTGGAPPSGAQGHYPPVSNQAGQVPLRRTGPDSPAGYGSSRYPSAGYGGGNVAGQPVQYAPSNGAAPGQNGGYAQPGSVSGGYGAGGYGAGAAAQPGYPQGGYAPGPFTPGAPQQQPSPYQPSTPFIQPNGGYQPGPGALGPQGPPPGPMPSPSNVGGFGGPAGGAFPGVAGPPPGGYGNEGEIFNQQPLTVPIDIRVQETQTGRLMFGVGVNSNAGLLGNVVIDEQNFDWRQVPTSWEDIRSARAFRGAGQQFRIEAMPGTQLSRYGFTFREPYLWDTRINFGIDGYYFNRYFQNWTEQRAGARVSFGYLLTPDLSTSLALRGESVRIFNPTVPSPPELTDVLGRTSLFTASWTTVHDTRDSPFLPTQGHRISVDLEQGFGTFSFPRAILGFRQHFLVYERPDGSGKQVINLINDTGFTGSHTPLYENFFAGGYNTLRGFYFRGASPLDMGVQVGGKFEFLNTVEYMFPITPTDALRGVVFTDFGTVERSTELKWQDFRIAPGFGLRVTIPAMGPAPIALDFAFPVHKAPGDTLQMFNFFVGVQR